ncbi:MAG: hypothetical protein WC375_00055 [Methanomassiliicoccales archaeon]|jgi:hypothetical protein
MNIEVVREEPDALNRHVWRFYLMNLHGDFSIFLDSYSQQVRATKRHGWKIKIADHNHQRIMMAYERLDSRRCGLTVQDTPLPYDVAKEAKEKVVNSIVVKKWSDK